MPLSQGESSVYPPTWVTQTWASMPKSTTSVGWHGSPSRCFITSSVHMEKSFFEKTGTCVDEEAVSSGTQPTRPAFHGCDHAVTLLSGYR